MFLLSLHPRKWRDKRKPNRWRNSEAQILSPSISFVLSFAVLQQFWSICKYIFAPSPVFRSPRIVWLIDSNFTHHFQNLLRICVVFLKAKRKMCAFKDLFSTCSSRKRERRSSRPSTGPDLYESVPRENFWSQVGTEIRRNFNGAYIFLLCKSRVPFVYLGR